MSLIDRVTRSVIDTTARSIALGTEITAIALRGAAGAVSPEVADQVRRAIAEPLQALLDIPGAVQQTTGLPIPRQALDTANVMRTLVAPDVDDATDADLVRRRFDELIERSTHVGDDAGLPAFLEVVAQLTPDEARILRLLADEGPAPVMDLDAVSLVGRSTRTVLSHQTMVADRAGCVKPEEVSTYLANLERLGIVEFRGTELEGHADYQLIEGTPTYRAAARQYREDRLWRARGRRGSLHLSTFGGRFAAICMGRPADTPLSADASFARSRPTRPTRPSVAEASSTVPTDGAARD